MPNTENKMPKKPETQDAPNEEQLNEEQLDDVSAGINPQPLPPIVRDHI